MGNYMWRDVDYPCFTANEAGSTIRMVHTGSGTPAVVEFSIDGKNRTEYTMGDTITLTNVGDKVYWRNTKSNNALSSSDSNYHRFHMTGSIAGSGDLSYLANKNGTDTLASFAFYTLFYSSCAALTSAPKLPSTTLGSYCYHRLFSGTSITTPPELPADTLGNYCYNYMFGGCTGLTKAPKLNATSLGTYCYRYMFEDCSNLEELPELAVLDIPASCYNNMFNGCSKIKLSATQTGEYQTAYRIPKTGTGTAGGSALANMFTGTGGTFTGTPSINTTYYTSNAVV